MCVLRTTPSFAPPLTFLRLRAQLERCSPLRHAFPSSCLVLPRGIRNFLAITYSDNFLKTFQTLVIFKLHGLPPFCFPLSWCFR